MHAPQRPPTATAHACGVRDAREPAKGGSARRSRTTTYVKRGKRMASRAGSPAWNLLVIPDSSVVCGLGSACWRFLIQCLTLMRTLNAHLDFLIHLVQLLSCISRVYQSGVSFIVSISKRMSLPGSSLGRDSSADPVPANAAAKTIPQRTRSHGREPASVQALFCVALAQPHGRTDRALPRISTNRSRSRCRREES